MLLDTPASSATGRFVRRAENPVLAVPDHGNMRLDRSICVEGDPGDIPSETAPRLAHIRAQRKVLTRISKARRYHKNIIIPHQLIIYRALEPCHKLAGTHHES